MKKKQIKSLVAISAALMVGSGVASAQFSEAELQKVQQIVTANVPAKMGIGNVKAKSLQLSGDTIVVNVSENFGDIPFTKESIAAFKADVKQALGADYQQSKVALRIAGSDVEKYFASFDKKYAAKHTAFITDQDPNRRYKMGLDGNIVATWQSHGWYFEPKLNRWEWQRARMFNTVEDMYTQSYITPYLIPMLENAGAYVWDARERDTHNFSSVVDMDGKYAQHGYTETNGKMAWTQGNGAGFAFNRGNYRDFENPFAEGTYRMVQATKDKNSQSFARYDVEMREAGDFALYISYKSLPNSAKDVTYIVNSLSGEKRFTVDQTMAGGVWVYLGTFQLKKGWNKDVVMVSNLSKDAKSVITTDAIKVGGGRANVVRRVALPTEENKALAKKMGYEQYVGQEDVAYDYVHPGDHPWFALGARYYLQWAGFPQSVYSSTQGLNDYNDDYRSRGLWVNHLAGGSAMLPGQEGLKVPVDVSFALHTDAGTNMNDDIIGTLLIYSTSDGENKFGNYKNGTPRILSREFADMVSTEVCDVIRAKYEPNWSRRGMWDKSYYEARVPEVPALLMELLSHQNFADMKYGLDPNFRFDVSRAIYKGILKFIAKRDHRDYVVQPLPVNSFAIKADGGNAFTLTWKPTADAQCASADAKRYVVMERVGLDGGFKEIAIVNEPSYGVKIADNLIHSYKIVAMNDGGRSFPSEVLSLGVAANSKGRVAVVNNFTRVCGPDWFDSGKMAGFYSEKDHGVPYMQQNNYIGDQYEFERRLPWVDDDDPGFGACRSDYELGSQVVAGNNFDYTTVHGAAIMNAGYSFVSMSEAAFESGAVKAADYKMLDIILGKQKETINGRGAYASRFKIYTPEFMNAVTAYTAAGGNVMLTGAYVASDIWEKEKPVEAEVKFAKTVLGFEHRASRAAQSGKVSGVVSKFDALSADRKVAFCTSLNSKAYAVESPDAVKASDAAGATIMRYSENTKPAAVAVDRGTYRTVVAGFPFESINNAKARNAFMNDILKFLNK
ncbi:MAG: xanthan lyase [Bacteroidales bacterium]|nr:xanthan lyase [Bacteroidales bacterium]